MSVFKSKFPKTSLYLCGLWAACIAASLAHDNYAAQKDGSSFYFAHIGRVFEKYLPAQFEQFVNLVGVERVNGPLEPVMTFPLTFVFIALFALTVLIGAVCMMIRKQPSALPNPASVKAAPSIKDRALPKRH